jgi:hypothetical protein
MISCVDFSRFLTGVSENGAFLPFLVGGGLLCLFLSCFSFRFGPWFLFKVYLLLFISLAFTSYDKDRDFILWIKKCIYDYNYVDGISRWE